MKRKPTQFNETERAFVFGLINKVSHGSGRSSGCKHREIVLLQGTVLLHARADQPRSVANSESRNDDYSRCVWRLVAAVRHRQYKLRLGKSDGNISRSAKSANYSVVGYYFRSKAEECLAPNQQRTDQVPDVGVLSTARKLELPTSEEGFNTLKYVRLTEDGFVVEEWNDEV
ncbi:MAG: hypothetical protein R3C20_19200 [Planctomycetaceae bacterium]